MNENKATKQNKFRINGSSRIDWPELCKYIHSQGGYDTKSGKEWAEEFDTSNVTLSYKYSMFVNAMEAFSEMDLVQYSETLAKREINIKKEQAKLTHQRKAIQKEIKEKAFRELVLQEIELEKIKPVIVRKALKSKSIGTTQLFFITDMHYLNMDVSAALLDIAHMIIANWDGSSIIKIIDGGDAIENRHHADQVRRAASAIKQGVQVGDIWGAIISHILEEIDVQLIEYYPIPGNHDQIRQGGEKAGDNLEEVVTWSIVDKLHTLFDKTPRVNIYEPVNELHIELNGKDYNFRHGHIGNISDKMLMKKMIDNEYQTGVQYDTYIVGHFHRYNDWFMKGTGKRFILGPSMKTWDSNFENANVLRSTCGILSIRENHQVTMIPWTGEKKNVGELNN